MWNDYAAALAHLEDLRAEAAESQRVAALLRDGAPRRRRFRRRPRVRPLRWLRLARSRATWRAA